MLKVLLLFIFPSVCFANTAMPALPIANLLGLIFIPILFVVEALYYKSKSIESPFSFALRTNLFSALVGLILISIPGIYLFQFGIAYETAGGLKFWAKKGASNMDMKVYGSVLMAFVSLIVNYASSVVLEKFIAGKLKPWKNTDISWRTFMIANAFSYSLIFLFFAHDFYKKLELLD